MRIRIISSGGLSVEHDFTPQQLAQARRNHYQSLEQLEARGGLAWPELTAILDCVAYERIVRGISYREYCEKKHNVTVITDA